MTAIPNWSHQLITGDTTPDAIRDIHVTNSAHDSVDITYAIDSDTPLTLEAGIYVDGALNGRVPATQNVASAANLRPGTHSLEILPLRQGQKAPQRQGYTLGDRVYLQWNPSTSPYLSHYNIYRDGTLIGTVEDRQVYPLDFHTTSAGGRVSVFGYPSTDINDTITVTPDTDSFTFDGQTYEFVTGSPISLPYGVMIIFHDDANEYSPFDIFIGVQNWYLTDSLAAGTYTFSVEAVDAAGNVSTQLTRSISVVELATLPTISGTSVLAPNSVAKINIYSDYNPTFDTHDAHINTNAPTQKLLKTGAVNLPTGLYMFNDINLPAGTRYYAWPVHSNGLEHEDYTIRTVSDPETPEETFNVPADVALTPSVDGNMNFSFTYRRETGDSATQFRIYYGTDPDALVASMTLPANLSNGIRTYNTTLPALYTTGTTVYAQARAESATSQGELSDVASAVAMADDPTLAGPLYGVQT